MFSQKSPNILIKHPNKIIRPRNSDYILISHPNNFPWHPNSFEGKNIFLHWKIAKIFCALRAHVLFPTKSFHIANILIIHPNKLQHWILKSPNILIKHPNKIKAKISKRPNILIKHPNKIKPKISKSQNILIILLGGGPIFLSTDVDSPLAETFCNYTVMRPA